MQQVAYTVADVDATSAALRDRGVRLLYDAPAAGTAGSRINFVHPKDAGGVLVELVEPARRARRSAATGDSRLTLARGDWPVSGLIRVNHHDGAPANLAGS